MDEIQPGQVISPGGSGQPAGGAPEPERPTEQPQPTPTPNPTPSPEPASEAAVETPVPIPPAEVAQESVPEENANWQFSQETSATTDEPLPGNITWSAAEFIAHEKNQAWYAKLVLAGLVLAAIVYLVTKDKISTGVVIFAVIAFAAVAGRKPQTQEYSLSHTGISIGNRTYNFQDFKTFSVAEDGSTVSIIFMPLKRFMPALTIYVAPEAEDKVVDFLSEFLPFEQHKVDAVDGLMKRMRF